MSAVHLVLFVCVLFLFSSQKLCSFACFLIVPCSVLCKDQKRVLQLMHRWASDACRNYTRCMPAVLLSAKDLCLVRLSGWIARSVASSYCFPHASTQPREWLCGHEFLLTITKSHLWEQQLLYIEVDFRMSTSSVSDLDDTSFDAWFAFYGVIY